MLRRRLQGMTSDLRNRLLLLLLLPLCTLALLGVWMDYRSADEAAMRHDQRLLRLLPALADSVLAPGVGESQPVVWLMAPPIEDFLRSNASYTGYSVRDLSGNLLLGDDWVRTTVPETGEPEFHSVEEGGVTYRVAVQRGRTGAGELVVALADGTDPRQQWAQQLLLRVLLPNLLLVAAALVGMGSSVFHPEASRVARMAAGAAQVALAARLGQGVEQPGVELLQRGHAQRHQLHHREQAVHAVGGLRLGKTLLAPAHGRVVGQGVVRGNPGRVARLHVGQGQRAGCGGVERCADHAQLPAHQVLRRALGGTHGDVGVTPREAHQLVAGVQLELQQRVLPLQRRQRRRHQAVQDGVGGGDAHQAAGAQVSTGHP